MFILGFNLVNYVFVLEEEGRVEVIDFFLVVYFLSKVIDYFFVGRENNIRKGLDRYMRYFFYLIVEVKVCIM